MLNYDVARKALAIITRPDAPHDQRKAVEAFIDEVECLMKHNSIKQVPALLKPKEKGS